jgi:hypothetical protein
MTRARPTRVVFSPTNWSSEFLLFIYLFAPRMLCTNKKGDRSVPHLFVFSCLCLDPSYISWRPLPLSIGGFEKCSEPVERFEGCGCGSTSRQERLFLVAFFIFHHARSFLSFCAFALSFILVTMGSNIDLQLPFGGLLVFVSFFLPGRKAE